MALKEIQGLLELLHGAVEGRGQEEHAQRTSVTRIMNANADAILAALVLFHAAAIVIANSRSAGWHVHSPIQNSWLEPSIRVCIKDFGKVPQEGAVWQRRQGRKPLVQQHK